MPLYSGHLPISNKLLYVRDVNPFFADIKRQCPLSLQLLVACVLLLSKVAIAAFELNLNGEILAKILSDSIFLRPGRPTTQSWKLIDDFLHFLTFSAQFDSYSREVFFGAVCPIKWHTILVQTNQCSFSR